MLLPIAGVSCKELREHHFTEDGVYPLRPDNQTQFDVRCDMTTEGGGWEVFQRRVDGSVSFTQDWLKYKNGFGDLEGEFWLGNEKMHRLTNARPVILRVDLADFENGKAYVEYSSFSVSDEQSGYRLSISGYSGTGGTALNERKYF